MPPLAGGVAMSLNRVNTRENPMSRGSIHLRYRTRRSPRVAIAAFAAVALVATACGADNGDADVAEPDEEPADTEAETDTDDGEAAAVGETIEADPITLSYASFVTDQNPHSVVWETWMEQVTERTDGAVTFETYYGEALCAAPEIASCTTDGRVDIGFTTATYTPADFPAATIANVPFQTSNLQANVDALNELYAGSPMEQEFEGLNQQLLYFGPVGLPVLASTQPVETLDDLSGMSIRGVGDLGDAFEALGINPVAIAPAEQYESLQRGVLDGAAFTIDGHADFRHFEVADYWYDLGEYTGSYAAMHTAINLDVWNSLSPELQDLMDEVSADVADSITTDVFVPLDERDCGIVVEEGAEHFGPLEPAEEAQAWADEWGDRLLEQWISNATDAGVDDPETLADDYRELLDEYEAANPDFRGAGEICIEIFES